MAMILYLAEAILYEVESWAEDESFWSETSLLYSAGEPVTVIYFALSCSKDYGRSISDQFLDELIKLRNKDYFEPEYWEDEQLLKILPWFEQRRNDPHRFETKTPSSPRGGIYRVV